MIYLASPHSHPDPGVREIRFRQVAKTTGYLIRNGFCVFSPIAHSHPIDLYTPDLPKGWDFWKKADTEFIRMASEVYVLMLAGWSQSVGVTAEIKLAKELGIPITYIEPENDWLDVPFSDVVFSIIGSNKDIKWPKK